MDVQKFLNQSGVSVLWSRVADEVAAVDAKAVKNAEDIAAHAGKIATMEGQIAALEAGTYDDSEVRGLISDNAEAIGANAEAIAALKGDGEGSVSSIATVIAAAKVAEIVAGADQSYDTLKEIADWIASDTTGAAEMSNKITALEGLVGSKSVATQIAEAIADEDLDKYALASDLTDLATRVKALEDAGHLDITAVNAAIDAKVAALDLANTYDTKGAASTAETNAKAYADGLAVNYDVKGAAAAAQTAAEAYSDANLVSAKAYSDANLATAKTYADTELAKIQALTEAEIDAAINSAKSKQ